MKVEKQNKFPKLHCKEEDDSENEIVELATEIRMNVPQKSESFPMYKKQHFVHTWFRWAGIVM